MSDRESAKSLPWPETTWAIIAAFGAYFSIYAFRKPFTSATYSDYSLFASFVTDAGDAIPFKQAAVTAQMMGYMVAKFLGIRILSELPHEKRATRFLNLIILSWGTWIAFALIPPPWNISFVFLNGLSQGMMFGLVLAFLEGRRMTELLVAGLCASFIVADGVVKSLGTVLLNRGISEFWMPATAGLIFLPLALFFVWMLRQIREPTILDKSLRSPRVPMTLADRWHMLRKHAPGLACIVTMYFLVTILRSMRADFAPEIWRGLGEATPPSIYSRSELWVAGAVMLSVGLGFLIHDNRVAFFSAMVMAACGWCLVLFSVTAIRQQWISPFVFMVLLGIGLYIPYVIAHTTIFERLIAMTRDKANMGFLLYVADSIGYLGYVMVVLFKGRLSTADFAQRYLSISLTISWIAIAAIAFATLFFARVKVEPASDIST
jgi:Family of unknown function (DUF5690)